MKVVFFYLSYCYLLFFTLCKTSAILDTTTTNTELKTKIFVIRQAIEKLKNEITKLNNDDNRNKTISEDETTDNEMKFNFKQNENQNQNDNSDSHLSPLELDFKKDENINEEVYGYFNKNPHNLKIDDLKKQIRENGYREIKDLTDVFIHHPDKIYTGVSNPNVLFYSQNKVQQEKKIPLPPSMSAARESRPSFMQKETNNGGLDVSNNAISNKNNIRIIKKVTNGPLKENDYQNLKYKQLARN